METPTANGFFLTSLAIGLEQGAEDAIAAWANRFLDSRDKGFPQESRALLYGMKPYKSTLDIFGRGLVLQCEGLWEDLWGTTERAEKRLRKSIELFYQSHNLSLISGALNDLGVLYYRHGDFEQARTCYEEGLRFLPVSSTKARNEPMLYNNLGLTLYQCGQTEMGMEHIQRAADLYQATNDYTNNARVWVNFGHFLERQGATEEALEVLKQALQVLRELQDVRILVELLNILGILYRYRGAWQEAEEYFHESFSIAHQIRDVGGQAQVCSNLGVVAQVRGKYAVALQHYHNALTFYTEAGDKHGIALVAGNIGHIASLEGNHLQALVYYQESLRGFQTIGDSDGEIKTSLNIAVAYRDLEQFETAETWYDTVYTYARAHPQSRHHDRILAALGYFRCLQGHWAEAEALLHEALTVQQQRQDAAAQVETYLKLGILAHHRGDYEQVQVVTQPGWELAQTYDYGKWLIEFAILGATAAQSSGSPAMFRYETTVWYYAMFYDSPENGQAAATRIFDFVDRVFSKHSGQAVVELVEWLLTIWDEAPWAEMVDPLRHELYHRVQRYGYASLFS